MNNKSKKIIIFLIIAVFIIAAVVIFVLPNDLFKKSDSNTASSQVQDPTFGIDPVRTDDEYNIMASKAKAYEDGDESVFSSYEEYIRAKSYLKSYYDHKKSFGEQKEQQGEKKD